MPERLSLPVVDGLVLPDGLRRVLRPDQTLRDRRGRTRRLPRFFYEVPSWEAARETRLTEHFALWELLDVDVWEAEPVRERWPRYVPCAVTHLAHALELFRREVDTYVHVAANGGYRTPGHRLSTHASPHCWGTAANVYRVGDDDLDTQAAITRYRRVARSVLPAAHLHPYGHGPGHTDDHLHLDLGYVVAVPHEAPGEERAARPGGEGGGGAKETP